MPSPKVVATLKSLQAVDSEIFALDRERKERPKSLESARAELVRKRANVDGKKTEGSWRSHQVPFSEMASKPEHVKLLESWMKGYKPEDLFEYRKWMELESLYGPWPAFPSQ
mgnify:CR=1 FL=1